MDHTLSGADVCAHDGCADTNQEDITSVMFRVFDYIEVGPTVASGQHALSGKAQCFWPLPARMTGSRQESTMDIPHAECM